MNGNSITVSMKKYSKETLEAIKSLPGITSVVEVFTEEAAESLRCMLMAYTPSDPVELAEVLSNMDNIQYAQATPVRYLIAPVKE